MVRMLSQVLKIYPAKAVVVVGGGSMKRFGFLDKAVDYLKEAGMEVKLIEGVEPDPSVETVMKGAAVMREFEPDWIVAMGGGSPIDAAKAMWVFYEYPDTTFDEIITPFSFPTLRTKAKFCAIPSTSGTATEVTAFSVITDYARVSNIRLLTLISHLMLLSLILHLPKQCRLNLLLTQVWTL